MGERSEVRFSIDRFLLDESASSPMARTFAFAL